MAAVHPVDHVWRLPDDTHPDGRQSFVSFQQRPGSLSDDVLLVDVSVHDLSPARSRVDVRRHGVPQVLTGGGSLDLVAYGAADSPRPAQLLAALAQARARLGTGEWLVHRAIRRGARAEAADLHQRFALASLARLLRIRHCPWRHDYGLRYLADDLGPDLARRVEDLLPVGDLEDQAERCFAWQRSLLEGPDVVAWPEHDGRVLAGLDTGAAPQRVWEALTDGDALATWWGRLEGRPAAGAAYTIWHGEQHPAHHRVRTWEPGRRLVLGWSFPDEPDSELVLEIDDDGRLTLEHTGVADAAEYAAGWEQHLRFLHAHLAGSPLPWDMFWEDWEARYTAHRDLLTRQARPPAQ